MLNKRKEKSLKYLTFRIILSSCALNLPIMSYKEHSSAIHPFKDKLHDLKYIKIVIFKFIRL